MAIVVFKSVALMLSLGSGTSGGLLAPMFMASAGLGGIFAMGIDRIVPGANLAPGAFALVAMGAVFGASARATFTFIVFAFEITRDYDAVLPLMLVSVIATAIAMRFLPHSIMTEKLARRGLKTHQDYELNVMKQVPVGKIMATDVATVAPDEMLGELTERLASGDARLGRHHAFPVVERDGRLIGMVTQGDILRSLESNADRNVPVLDVSVRSLIVTYPDETAFDALTKMLVNNIGRLPVVDRAHPEKMVGYVSRATLMACWGAHLHDESIRETGWLRRMRTDGTPKSPKRHTVDGRVVGIGPRQLSLSPGTNGMDRDATNDRVKEFVLDYPVPGIGPGDRVRVVFGEENGRNVAKKIEELPSRQ